MAPSMAPVIGSTSSWISKSWRRDASIGTSRPQLRIQILSAQEIQKSYPLPLSDVYVYIYVYCVFIYYVSIIFYHLIESNDHYSLSRLTLGYFWQDPGHDSVSLLRRFKVSVWTSGVDRHPQISQIQILQLTSTYHNLPIISPSKKASKKAIILGSHWHRRWIQQNNWLSAMAAMARMVTSDSSKTPQDWRFSHRIGWWEHV